MKLNITYRKGGDSGEWNSEENEVISRWNRFSLALLLVFVLSALAGASARTLTFAAGESCGFADWFLFCSASPLLGVWGLINMFTGGADTALAGLFRSHPVAGLLILNLILYGFIWLLGRVAGIRFLGAAKLRIASNFLMILVCWGIFQLLLFGTTTVWKQSGIRQTLSPTATATEQN